MTRIERPTAVRSAHAARIAGLLAEAPDRRLERTLDRIRREVRSVDSFSDSERDGLSRRLREFDRGVLGPLSESRPLDRRTFERFGRECAQAEIPLVDVHAILWISFEIDWDGIVDTARAHDVPENEIIEVASVLWSIARTASTSAADAYRAAAVRYAVHRDRLLAAAFRSLLADAYPDPDTARQSLTVLGLDAFPRTAVVVACAPTTMEDALPGIQDALAEVALPSSWQIDLGETSGIVGLRDDSSLATLVSVLGARNTDAVGVSSAQSPLHITRAHRQAWIAMESTRGRADVAVFGDRVAGSIVASAPIDIVSPLVRQTLAGLDAVDDESREGLLATFLAWVDNRGDVPAVARLSFRHPNTIRYRLRRLESLTGRSLKNPSDLVDLTLAARIALRTSDTSAHSPLDGTATQP